MLLVGDAVMYSGVPIFSDGMILQSLDTASTVTTVQYGEILFYSRRTTNKGTKCKFSCFVIIINVLFWHFVVYDDWQMVNVYIIQRLVHLKWYDD